MAHTVGPFVHASELGLGITSFRAFRGGPSQGEEEPPAHRFLLGSSLHVYEGLR